VIVSRPAAATPALKAALKQRGKRLLVQPLLSVSLIDSPINGLDNTQVVIATSAVAITEFAKRTESRDAQVAVVGEAAATAAREAGFAEVETFANAAALANEIRAKYPPDAGSLLYITGRYRARDLKRMLPAFDVATVEIYAAIKNRQLTPMVRRALASGRATDILFYSARAAEAFAAAAKNAGLDRQAKLLRAHCLSRRIAARLQARGWKNAWGAATPSGRALANRVTNQSHLIDIGSQPAPGAQGFGTLSTLASVPLRSPAMTASPTSSASPAIPRRPSWLAFGVLAAAVIAGGYWLWQRDEDHSQAFRAAIQVSQTDLAAQIKAVDIDRGKAERNALAQRMEEVAQLPVILDLLALQETIERTTALEQQTSETDAATARAISTIDQTLGEMAPVVGETAVLSARVETLAAQVTALRKATTAAGVAAADASRQATAIAALPVQVQALSAQIAALTEWVNRAQPQRVAEQLVALGELRTILNRGQPFAATLDRVRKVVPAAADSSDDWQTMSDIGIPTRQQLAAELVRMERAMPTAGPADSDSQWLDLAVGSIFSGISIEGWGELSADPRRGALQTVMQAVADGDDNTVLAALAKAGDSIQGLGGWGAKLAARRDAEATIAAWEGTVLAAIGEGSQ